MSGDVSAHAALLAADNGAAFMFFGNAFGNAFDRFIARFNAVKVEGSPDDDYTVTWHDVNGAACSETFTDPLAAVERAIELQGEPS